MTAPNVRYALLVAAAFLLTGCPPADQKASPAPAARTAACAKVGQNCEVSPGKLGTCVQEDDCVDGGPCFDCQSQH